MTSFFYINKFFQLLYKYIFVQLPIEKSIIYINLYNSLIFHNCNTKNYLNRGWFHYRTNRSLKYRSGVWWCPFAINRALNFSTIPSALYFTLNTHLLPIIFTLSDGGTNYHVFFFIKALNSTLTWLSKSHSVRLTYCKRFFYFNTTNWIIVWV